MIGDRIRQKRIIEGMSLQDLANELEKNGRKLTRAILSKYELGQTTPNTLVLRDLAVVLKVKTDYFFIETNTHIEWQAFRKKAALTQTKQEQIKTMAMQKAEQFVSIEHSCGISPELTFLPPARVCLNVEEAEQVAKELRELWGLGDNPIKSMSELLENRVIILIPLSTKAMAIDGLVGTLSGNRKIIVYEEQKSVERTRLTITHELGHLLLGSKNEIGNEKLANRFASAFLVPAKKLKHEMGNKRTSLSIPELCLLKEKYGISIQALTYRAKDLGILSESAFRSMFISFRSKGIHTIEPRCWKYTERPKLAQQYVFLAVAEGRISEIKAQEIYPEYFTEKMNMETMTVPSLEPFLTLKAEERIIRLQEAADSASPLYAKNSPLDDFTKIDDLVPYE